MMIVQDEIMIVDDTPEALDLLVDILTDDGYKACPVSSGEQALRVIEVEPPTLILLDIRMPGMDGFEVCRQLKANKKSRNIPILFISGASAPNERVEGLALGAVDFISKPFQREELLARVRTHLELNRLRTELEAQVEARTVELRKSEKALRESEERYRTIIENIEDGFYEVDLNGTIIFCNPSLARMLDCSQCELIGANLHSFTNQQHAKEISSTFHRMHQTGLPTKAFDWELLRKDGFKLCVEASASLILDTEGKAVGIRGIIRDITERKRMEDEMRDLSFRDQLTGLYNRRGFITVAEQQIKTANRTRCHMPLAFIDVDDMKWINDTLGHEEGDQALVDTATILRKSFRESDIIARIGGDEFAVLVTDVKEVDPGIMSSRLRQNIKTHNAGEARHYKLYMSCGIAIYDPEAPTTLDQLMAEADELMYRQKKANQKGSR